MTSSMQLMGLSTTAARHVFEFAHSPALYADPERIAAVRPSALQNLETHPANLSAALALAFELPELKALDTFSPLHRAALLPREWLRELAWYLGLQSAHIHLRKLVLRQDLENLANDVQSKHWHWVFQAHDVVLSRQLFTANELRDVPIAAWPARLLDRGWQLLHQLTRSLPVCVGRRMQLKLPLSLSAYEMGVPPELTDQEVGQLQIQATHTYTAMVSECHPEWEQLWVRESTLSMPLASNEGRA